MFWGLRLEPGKRYSTTVDKSFHVSMAALDCSTVKGEKDIQSVMLEEGESNSPFILCNLQKPKLLQSHLDLNFMSGDRITFFCRGNGTVHLTGYIMPDDDDDVSFPYADDDNEEEEEEEVEEEEENEDDDETEGKGKEIQAAKGKAKLNGLPAKRKGDEGAAGLPSKKKKPELEIPGDSDDSDEDEDGEEEEEDDSDDDEEEDDEEEVEDEESEEESEEDHKEEEKKTTPPPANLDQKSKKKKKNKKGQQNEQSTSPQQQQQQQGKQKQQAAADNTTQPKKKPQQGQQPGNEKQGADEKPKKTLEGGVIVKDLKLGNGPLCKPGRMVTVYYTGRLKSNNKVFDQSQQGPGFKFRLGRGEVIKGWDVGLAGMKVGGKRLITIPPNMGYGQKGSPPTIPGSSTLLFEVELKAVN